MISPGMRFSIMRQFRAFALVILVVLLKDTSGSDLSPSNDEGVVTKSYDEVKNESELYSLIIEKDYVKALKRVQLVPSEAKIMINVLGGNKKQDVIKSALPLHFAFEVDIPENLPAAKRRSAMDQDQADLILALIKANPLGTAQKDKFGRLPLHIALISPNPPPVTVIKKMVELYPESFKMEGLQGLTPLHMAVSYPMTTLENVKAVLEANPEAIESLDEDESLPVHLAAWGGDLPEAKAVIELLLKEEPDHLSTPDGDGETIMTLMALYGRTSEEAIRFILKQDKKAATNYREKESSNTPLHLAVSASFEQNNTAYKPFLELHKDLLEKVNSIGQLPLHVLLQRCCAPPEMTFDLISAYPAAISSEDGHGLLPLHHACNVGVSDVNIVKIFIEKSPESVKTEVNLSAGGKGPLPLHLALAHKAKWGKEFEIMNEVIEILLSAYPEASTIWDPESALLPLHAAFISKRSPVVLKQLMSLTPDEISTKVYIQEDGERKTTTILHLFAAQSHALMEPQDIIEIIEYFAAHDIDLFKEKDSDGRLPLHMVWAQLETKEKSRQALVDALLAKYPNAVHVADVHNMPPLAYITRALDMYSFEKVIEMNPFAAAVKSDKEMYPLHQVCNSGASGALSESIDKIMTSLLKQHPKAAAEMDDSENLPLHSLCITAGSSHTTPPTIQKLIDAYPEALNITDKNGMIPLQLAAISATNCDIASDLDYWADLVEVLIDAFPATVNEVQKGDLVLAGIFSQMETLSVHRRSEEDHLLRIVKRLYSIYPNAIQKKTTKGRTGLHSLLVLVGDMGAMTPRGWSDVTLQVIRDFPELLESKDSHQRTPLHLFCLYLGDTAIGLRDNQDPRTRLKLTAALESILLAMVKAYPEALDAADEYDYAPLDLASHARLRYSKGGKRFYRSEIVNMMKSILRRGSAYWKMKTSIEKASTCSELEDVLVKVEQQVLTKLDKLQVEPSNLGDEYTCDSKGTRLCEACPGENELLGKVESYLAVYAEIMIENGKDANEMSGDYLIDSQ